ncbi:MAG TPA: hypothetical protein VL490_02080 [Mucilaginibacter sp.]|jgi:hypothetical protein|nr:hypothetical protein [Mucilaginibacter sp.]
MMKTFYYLTCAVVAQTFAIGICKAQTLELKPAPAGVVIDGSSKEWGDSMPYTYKKVTYNLSNDKDNLYLVIKTKDADMQSSILGAGVTFAIDTKGKKKSSYVVTFPAVPADMDQSRYMNMNPATIKTNLTFASKYGKMTVSGFKDFSDGDMTADNTYGVKTAIGYDNDGYMVYEEVIPLKLFHADDTMKEWAFNIKFNPVQGKGRVETVARTDRAAQDANRDRGRNDFASAARRDVPMVDLTTETDFWGKFSLAKAQ